MAEAPSDVAATANKWADWLVDAVATSTQNRMFLRGDASEDTYATEAIYLNGKQAIEMAVKELAAKKD